MRTIILCFLLITSGVFSQNQQVNFGNNTPKNRTEWYRPNSPTSIVGDREVAGWVKSYDVFEMHMDTIRFTKLHSGINKGTPSGVLWTDSNGVLKYSPNSEIRIPYSQITSPPTIPPSQIQTDWNASSGLGSVLNKPTLSAVASSGSYIDLTSKPTIPTDNDQLTNGSGFTTSTSANTLTNKSGNISQWTNNIGYITSFTEIDPTVPIYSKSLSAFSIIKSSTDPLYKAIGYSPTSLEVTTALGYTPYNSANPSNFITGITSGQVTTALGFTPLSAEVDGSITNEIQSLSIVGNTVSLSNGGGSVVIPNNTYTAGSGISIASNVVTNTNPDQIIVLNSGNRILITGTYPNFTISYIEPIINTPVARTLNSNFTISTTKQAIVSYSVTCSVTNPLLVGTSTAMSYLEYSINSGTTWLLPAQNGNSSGVGLTVTVQLTNGQTGVLAGVIPANALVRLRTAITGTASVTYVTGTEIY